MKKRIISFILTLVILAGSVLSATAIDTAGLTEVVMPLKEEYFTGSTDSIKGGLFTADGITVSYDEYGNKSVGNVKGGDRYIKSKIAYNLGDKFQISFTVSSDNQNPNSNNRIVYQFGNLAVAYFSYGTGTGQNSGVVRLYYGTDVASIKGSGISYNTSSKYLIAESTNVGIDKKKVVIGFDNGAIDFAVYNDSTAVFKTTATIGTYDFSSVKPAIRAYKSNSVWDNGLYTTGFSILTELDGAAITELIDSYDVATLNDEGAANVRVIRQWYDSLSQTEQANVSNYASLQALEVKASAVEAEALNKIFGELVIDEITIADKSTIGDYREQYDALTDEQKQLVTNYGDFVAAENEINRLIVLKQDGDAADIVNDEILAMGTIDYSNYLYVSDARYSYETLTEQGKTLVADYKVLTDAEETVKTIKKAATFKLVNQLIADLPETVTLADDKAVFNALGAYSMLSTAEKRLVTDINSLIDDANALIQMEAENNELISPKIVELVQIGELYGSSNNKGVLPDKTTGLYYGLPSGVEVYAGDTVKPGVYRDLYYDVTYDEQGVPTYKNSGRVFNITTGGSNWWGNNFQPVENGASRNVKVGTLEFFHSNYGFKISSIEVKARPTYEYNEIFDTALNVRTMIAALPKEYSKLTEDDRYLVNSANEALDAISVDVLDEVHEVRYLINAEKVLDGAVIEDEDNPLESYVVGDVTRDTVINSLDLLALQMHVLGIQQVIEADLCDINKNGTVETADLVALQMYIVGLSDI